MHRTGLGFYSDDHEVLGWFEMADGQSWSNLFKISFYSMAGMRPIQCIILVVLYKCFGLYSVGYQTVILLSYLAMASTNTRNDGISGSLAEDLVDNFWTSVSFHRNESDFGFNFWQFLDRDFFEYGIGLPYTAAKASVRFFHWPDAGLALAVGLLSAATVFFAFNKSKQLASRRRWLMATLAGIGLALAGYAIFAFERNIQFTLAGVGNRVSMMALPGVAIALLGILGLASTIVMPQARQSAFAVLVGLLCASGTLVNSAIAEYFADASRKQAAVLSKLIDLIQANALNNTDLVIGGFCPYDGPAPVFEASWDITGALRSRLRNPTIRAIVLNSNYKAEADAIRFTIYGNDELYEYGRSKGINVLTGTVIDLADQAAAERFVTSDAPACPPSAFGVGARIF